jgi:uncharacterized protein (DUF1800 family)
MATTWTATDAAHLLRRAGFGGSYEQVGQLHAMGRDGAINWLIEYDAVPDPSAQAVAWLGFDTGQALGLIQAQLYRMVASTRPLQEKLAWFWHGHFASALGKVPAALMANQLDTWRSHASGGFRAFLGAMYKDPAMLVYLDNDGNVAGSPNENFARELMERFTLGVGHCSETDVREAARALTGWSVLATTPGRSVFMPDRHDDGIKSVLGVTADLDAEDLMDILNEHPACGPFICARLYRYFVGSEPPEDELAALVDAWRQSDGRIGDVLHVLFRLDGFWATDNRGAQVKSPVEYGIGLYQRLHMPLTAETVRALAGALGNMGQVPLMPPDLNGYPSDLEWAGTSDLLARYNSAWHLAYGRLSSALLNTLLAGVDTATPRALLDGLLERLGPLDLGDASYAAVLGYLDDGGYGGRNPVRMHDKARGALHLIAATPEYQLN